MLIEFRSVRAKIWRIIKELDGNYWIIKYSVEILLEVYIEIERRN
jgi:hypothetical protein